MSPNAQPARPVDPAPWRVLLVDDSTRFREAAHRFLASDPRLEVVGAAASAAEALARHGELRPDLVLLDLELPDGHGLDVLRRLKRETPAPRVIIVTLYDVPHYRDAARDAGADGFVSKTEFGTEVPALLADLARNGDGNAPSASDSSLPRFLRESEERYRRLLDVSPDSVTLAFEDRILHINPAGVRLVGANEAGVLIGHSVLDLVPAEDREAASERMRSVAEGQALGLHTARVLRLDGSVIDVEATATPVSYQNRAAVQIVARDLSGRKRQQEELEEAQARYRDLVENVPLGVYQSGADGEMVSANRALRKMLGLGDGDLSGRSVLEAWIDPEERRQFVRRLERDGAVVGYEMRLRRVDDHEVLWVRNSVRAVRDPTGRLLRFEGTIEDITAERAMRESVRRSQAHLAEAQRLAGLGSWVCDLRTGKVEASDEAYRLWGYEAGSPDVTLEILVGLIVPEDRARVEGELQQAIADGETRDSDFRIRTPDGTVRWLHGRGRVETDAESGEPRRLIGTSQDVTASRTLAAELQRARDAALEASRLKSVFLANVSHEIRTPLNVVLGTSRVFAERLEELGDREYRPLMDAASRAGRRLTATIHGILDFSRLESGGFGLRKRLLQLRPLVNQRIEEIRADSERKGLSLDADLAADPEVFADEYCVSLAIAHLLDNAVKFTARGGIRVRLTEEVSSQVLFEVTDSGVGIDPAYLERLFEPFSQEDGSMTRPFEGNGLGLALSRRLLERNGALLEVESTKGRGSTFRIRFPRPRKGTAAR